MECSAAKTLNKLRRHRRLLSSSATRLLVLACVVFAFQTAQGQEAKEERAIRKVLQEQVEAWNRGDIDGYMQGYWDSDSTTFTSGGTLTAGYREVLSRYKKSYDTKEKMGKLEFRDLAIHLLSPTAAVAMGIWQLTRQSDKPWGRFTLIVEKKPEGWRITHDHTSSGGG